MSAIRGLAVRISGVVVRRASPGCKEWAEGLAREVEFIESDWRALGWAIGSLRVVLDRREEPLGSLAEVPKAAQRLVETIRGGVGMWPLISQGPLYYWKLLDAKCSVERGGCWLIVFGSIIAATFLVVERCRLKEPFKDDVYDDILACARFYRAELERRNSTIWI